VIGQRGIREQFTGRSTTVGVKYGIPRITSDRRETARRGCQQILSPVGFLCSRCRASVTQRVSVFMFSFSALVLNYVSASWARLASRSPSPTSYTVSTCIIIKTVLQVKSRERPVLSRFVLYCTVHATSESSQAREIYFHIHLCNPSTYMSNDAYRWSLNTMSFTSTGRIPKTTAAHLPDIDGPSSDAS
jgi:hypothetical protein